MCAFVQDLTLRLCALTLRLDLWVLVECCRATFLRALKTRFDDGVRFFVNSAVIGTTTTWIVDKRIDRCIDIINGTWLKI